MGEDGGAWERREGCGRGGRGVGEEEGAWEEGAWERREVRGTGRRGVGEEGRDKGRGRGVREVMLTAHSNHLFLVNSSCASHSEQAVLNMMSSLLLT